MRQPGKYGKTAPHPIETHPRVVLDNYTDFLALPRIPRDVDRESKVSNWPMYMNDQLGDCTCAAVGHQIQAWTAFAGSEATIADSDVLNLYEKVGGYVPGDPSTDNGANIQDVLTYWHANGVAGHKISAFAQIRDCTNPWKLKEALYLFGSVYLGIQCPLSAQQQFQTNSPWTYDPNSPIEGGHAIVLQEMVPVGTQYGVMEVVTWGALQRMTLPFAEHLIDEAWVIITPDWITANGTDIDGIDLKTLMADFAAITA